MKNFVWKEWQRTPGIEKRQVSIFISFCRVSSKGIRSTKTQNQKFWAHNRYFLTYLEKNNIWERKMYPCKKKWGRWESRTFVMVFITFKREGITKVNYWKFSTKNFFSKCDQIHQSSAELVTFTEEILGKFHFLCIASIKIIRLIARYAYRTNYDKRKYEETK